MLRLIAAVLIGYFVTAVVVILTSSLAYVVPDFAFHAGGSEVTMGWLIYSLFTGFIAAVAGGVVTRMVARTQSRAAVLVLAGICLFLGLAMAVGNLGQESPRRETVADSAVPLSTAD